MCETVTCHQSEIQFCNSFKHWNTIQKIERAHSFSILLSKSILNRNQSLARTEKASSRLHKYCLSSEEYSQNTFTLMFGCFTLIQHVLLHSNVIMDEFNMSRKLQESNTLNVSIKLQYTSLRNRI